MSRNQHSDPRPARSRAKLLTAAAALLSKNGPAAVTVDAVIESANVARATFYRHFASTNELVAAAFHSLIPASPMPPESGTLRERLTELVLAQARHIDEAQPITTAIAWLSLGPGLGQWDGKSRAGTDSGAVGTLRERIAEQYLAPFEAVFASDEAKELLGEVDPVTAMALLVGPLVMGRLSTLEDFDYDTCARAAVDGFIAVHTVVSDPERQR